MSAQLAAQLYTVRDFTKTKEGFDNVLGLCHEIGYAGVQLSAVGCMSGENPEVSAAEGKRMLEDHGLVCAATHVGWDALTGNIEKEIETHKTLGCDYIAIGGLWPVNYPQLAEFPATSAAVTKTLKANGIRFGYHNHSHEFVRREDTLPTPGSPASGTYYECLITGSDDLMLEIDTYWVAHAGVDPAKLLQRCAGRVPVIHVKDMEVNGTDGPVFAPVGEGNLDWPAILKAGNDAGVEWYIVEQDTCRRDPFDCLRSSFEYLEKML